MDIECLREFVVLGRTLSLAAGARELHISQSALSRHISSIEHEVNTVLMDRGATGSCLTEEGRFFIEEAIAILHRYDHALEGLRTFRKRFPVSLGGNLRSHRTLRIASAVASVMARRNLPVALHVYEPHTSASLQELSAHDPYAIALKGIVDVSLLWRSEQSDSSQFEHRSILHEPLVAFVPEEHPLSKREDVSLSDLCNSTLVLSTAYTNFAGAVLDAFRRAGLTPSVRTRVFESYGDMMIARHADEVFIVPQPDAGRVAPVSVSGLVPLDINDPNAYIALEVVYLKECANPGIPVFLEALGIAAEAIMRDATGCHGASCTNSASAS